MTAPLPPTTASDAELVTKLRWRDRVLEDGSRTEATIESTRDALRSAADRLDKLSAEVAAKDAALKKLVDAKALAGIREIVAGWNGEGVPDGPYPRHAARLGAVLKTNCGAVYELDEAMIAARASLSPRMEADNAV